MATMTDPMKLTKKHVTEKAEDILEDARRLGYFKCKCRVEDRSLLLMFAKRGRSVHYERQVGCGDRGTAERLWTETRLLDSGRVNRVQLKGASPQRSAIFSPLIECLLTKRL
jgi:hypothetical protein